MATGGELIGALRVTLGLDTAQFEQGTRRARNIAKRDAGEIQRIMGGVKTAFAGLAAAATATAFAAAAKRALDYAGGLGELAQQAGVSTRALQEYAAIGVDVGLSNDDIVSSFARLSKTLGAAQDGNKKAAETFRQLGIDVTGLTAESAMPKLIAAFERIKSPTDQARIASELFGRTAGAKLLPMLNLTSKGLDEAREAAHDLGLVLSDDAIESADAASDALSRLIKVVEVNFAAAMAGGADGVAAMSDELARMVAALPAQIDGIRKFAFAAAEALRVAGPFGDFVANKAKRASTFAMDNKTLVTAMRAAAKTARENPSDEEAVAFAQFLTEQGKSRIGEARRRSSTPAPVGEGGLVPRTARPGKSTKAARDRSAEKLERFQREMADLADQQLQLQIEQTTTLDERAQLEARRILTEKEAYNFQISRRVQEGELTAAQGEELKLAHAKIAADQQAIMWDRINAEKSGEEARLRDSEFDIRQRRLDDELDLARTQEDRRRIELRLLDLEYERERAAVEQVKAMYALNQATFAEVEAAERRLGAMEADRGNRQEAIRRRTMGPLESWLDEGRKGAGELREAFEGVTVDALNNSLDVASRNVLKLKGVWGDLFNQLIADVIRLNMQQALTGGGAGILGSIGKFLGLASSGPAPLAHASANKVKGLPGLAGGGSFDVGGRPGIDNQVLAIDGIPRVRVSATERIDVVPGHRGASAGRPAVVQLVVGPGQFFEPSVTAISGGVAVETVTRTGMHGSRAARQNLLRSG